LPSWFYCAWYAECAFAFVSGALAIGVGFGAQNIINNYISSSILMGERPINVGDFLDVEGVRVM
jgi:small-conductance mechanosensitive channel